MQLGKKSTADFVIELEIDQLKVHEETTYAETQKKSLGLGTVPTFHRVATCEIALKVIDVDNPDLGPKWAHEYSTCFPRFGHPPDASKLGGQEFRTRFFGFVARELALDFTTHPVADHYLRD